MPEASIVDREDVGIGLSDEVAECVRTPTLSDVASVAVDFFAVLACVIFPRELGSCKGDVQLTTTLVSADAVRSLNAVVLWNFSTGAEGRGWSRKAFSLRAYTSSGKTCQAYRVSPSGVWMLKGVTWPFAKPNCSALLMSW